MDRTESNENWFSRAKTEADKGAPLNERVVGVAIVVVSILIISYFVAHQVWSTGFFTSSFGALEMIMLYGNLAAWTITAPWKESLDNGSCLACLTLLAE